VEALEQIESHGDAALWIESFLLSVSSIWNESSCFVPADLANVGVGKKEAHGDISREFPRQASDALQEKEAMAAALVAIVNTDHLNTQGAKLGNASQILHALALGVCEANRIEGQCGVAQKWLSNR
jgi:hypothetical protein